MGISKRKSQSLSREIQDWIKQLEELNSIQIDLINKIFEQMNLLLIENQNEKAEIAQKIEDQIYDFLDKQNDLLFLIETIGGSELEIVEVNSLLNEINDEKKILEAIEISTKNFIKSTLDTKRDMQETIKNEIKEIIKAYRLKRNQITKSINFINETLSSKLKKLDFI